MVQTASPNDRSATMSDFHEKSLRVPYLHNEFPPGTDHAVLHHALTALHKFRRRAANHEPILLAADSTRARS